MKQFQLILGLLILFAASCMKDDENLFSQEDLNGTWEALETNSLGCIQQLEISDTVLSEIKICESIKVPFKAENYSFDGRIIRYELYGLNMEFEVTELTDRKLVLGYHDPVEYKRISK